MRERESHKLVFIYLKTSLVCVSDAKYDHNLFILGNKFIFLLEEKVLVL
jgi:hypothetical protein